MHISLIDSLSSKAYHFEVPDGQQSEETEEIISELGFNISHIDWISSEEPIEYNYIDAKEAVETVKRLLTKNK